MDKLQEWLKDKKNQPIVAGVLILVLVVAGLVVYMSASGGGSDSDETAIETQTMTNDQATGVRPTEQTAPVSNPVVKVAAKPAVKKVAAASVIGRIDPFLPVGWAPPRVGPAPPPPYVRVPDPVEVQLITRYRKGSSAPPEGIDIQQPPRRMAGLVLNGRIYAIIESNGSTELVQPGDMLKDRLAVVDRIDRDKVVLKTMVGEKRYIIVRMASASKVDSGTSTTNSVTPYSSRPGGYPRGPGGPGAPAGGLPRM